jgi:hypothetical protein
MHAFDKEYNINAFVLKFSLTLVSTFPPTHTKRNSFTEMSVFWNWVVEFPQIEMCLSSRHDSVVTTSFEKAIAQSVGEIRSKVGRLQPYNTWTCKQHESEENYTTRSFIIHTHHSEQVIIAVTMSLHRFTVGIHVIVTAFSWYFSVPIDKCRYCNYIISLSLFRNNNTVRHYMNLRY